METTQFKLTSSRIAGHLVISYKGGILNKILIEFKEPLTPKQWLSLTSIITPELKDLREEAINQLGLKSVPLPIEDTPLPGNERIAIFCEYYERTTGIKYKVTNVAGAKMKALPVSGNEFAICIKVYFESKEWYLTPKSIENFCGKINEIRQLISNPPEVKQSTKFPIPYDQEYAKGLTIGKLTEYWKVLREAGYVFQDKKDGKPGQWIKSQTIK
jgi:hypothetical protein